MQILLLGAPRILLDQRPFETLRRKNKALLYYLAAHTQAQTRDQILALFWPDTPRPAAQQTLRTMLHDLRSQLGLELLVIAEDRLSLGQEVQVDARRFSAALALGTKQSAAELAAIMELYRGDFLEGFTLPDAPDFDDWAQAEREAYRSQVIRGYAALSHLREAQQDYTAALGDLNRALALDPLQEELQRDALRLHYRSGDRVGAIRRYEALCGLLSDELGVPPMAETRALYDAIINDTLPKAAPDSPQRTGHAATVRAPGPASQPLLPFTGRSAELVWLKSLDRSGKLVLIEGPPGVGKTRLAAELISARQNPDAPMPLILWGVAYELEQGLPYQPVVDALRGLVSSPDWPQIRSGLDLAPFWLAEIARLVPDLQAAESDLPAGLQSGDESRLWEGVNQFLQSLSRRRPVILLLDDLHWADAATLGFLGYLTRRAASASIRLAATAHPLEAHSRLALLVQALAHEDRLARLVLAPLTAADTRLVAEQLSQANQDLLSHWLMESAEGNPYFMTELVRHAFHTNLLQKDGAIDREALSSTPVLPPTIQNLILSRLIRLSENARRVLEVAAVVGREFDFELVYQALSLLGPSRSEVAILDALDELRAAVLIQTRGERFSFDHSLTMEVILQDMGNARRRLIHRQVAQALESLHQSSQDPVAGLIASHYAKSGFPQLAAPFAFCAGRYAASLAAWDEAIAFFEQALQEKIDPDQRPAVLIDLASARFHKGDFGVASQVFAQAIQAARDRQDLVHLEAAYFGLNQSFLPQSRFSEAIALGRELAASGPPELALCAQFIWAAGLSVESANPNEAETHLREAQRLVETQVDYHGPITRALIQYQLAGVFGQQGKSDQAVALYKAVLEAVRRDPAALDLLRQIMLYNDLAYHLRQLGDPGALDFARAGMKLAEERGSLTHLPHFFSTSGEIALDRGDLDEAENCFAKGLALAKQVHTPERVAGLTANLGLVARRRGLDDLARSQLLEALTLADELGVRHLAVRIRCWLAPLLPQAEARRRLQEARDMAEQRGFDQLLEEIGRLELETLSG